MNPSGISYLYLGKDRATALAEVLNKPPCCAAVASFRTRRDLLILDLSNLPEMPSLFDSKRYHERDLIIFLKYFIKEISKPVQKNNLEHLDYIPSQVVCEYFAKVFKTDENAPIDGLAYPSAIRPGGVNIVLFPPQRRGDRFSDLVCLSEVEEIRFSNWIQLLDAIR